MLGSQHVASTICRVAQQLAPVRPPCRALQGSELPELERRIARYHSLVWYSSCDVLHASSQELESAALSACHRLSTAAMEAASGKRGLSPTRSVRDESPDASPHSGLGRLACHVLATASQVLALGEVRRVDHSLKVRMRLVATCCCDGVPAKGVCSWMHTSQPAYLLTPPSLPPANPPCRRRPCSWCCWAMRQRRRS